MTQTRYVGIDPSTKTGVVILDKHGEIIDSMEITSKGFRWKHD